MWKLRSSTACRTALDFSSKSGQWVRNYKQLVNYQLDQEKCHATKVRCQTGAANLHAAAPAMKNERNWQPTSGQSKAERGGTVPPPPIFSLCSSPAWITVGVNYMLKSQWGTVNMHNKNWHMAGQILDVISAFHHLGNLWLSV